MKKGEEGYAWIKEDASTWRIMLVEVVKVTKRGTLWVTPDNVNFYETSGLYIYDSRWECSEQAPIFHGPVTSYIKECK